MIAAICVFSLQHRIPSFSFSEYAKIAKVDKKKIGTGKIGDLTKIIMDEYSRIVMNNNKKYSKWITPVY